MMELALSLLHLFKYNVDNKNVHFCLHSAGGSTSSIILALGSTTQILSTFTTLAQETKWLLPNFHTLRGKFLTSKYTSHGNKHNLFTQTAGATVMLPLRQMGSE